MIAPHPGHALRADGSLRGTALREKIRDVLHETDILIQAVQEGKLHVRGHAEKFGGGWRELVVGLNNVIDAFVEPIKDDYAFYSGLFKDQAAADEILYPALEKFVDVGTSSPEEFITVSEEITNAMKD